MINLILILSAVADFFLSGLIFIKTPNFSKNRLFAYCCLAFGFWTIFIVFFRFTNNLDSARIYSQLIKLSAGFIASTFLHFVFNTTGRRLNKLQKILIHAPNAILMGLMLIPGALIADIKVHEWGKESVSGPLYYLFSLYFFTYVVTGIVLIYRRLRVSKGIERIRLTYFFWTAVITSLIGIYFNLYLVLIGNYKYVWVGPYNSLVMCGLISFAILKANLLDIRLVATRSVARVIVFILIAFSFVTTLYFFKSISSFLLTSFLCVALGIFWAVFAEKLRVFIQTPLEKAFLVNNYRTSDVLNRISTCLASVFNFNEALDCVIDILKEELEISTISKSETGFDEGRPFLSISHEGRHYFLVFGEKLSEDPYTKKDISLISAVEKQLEIIQDRISKVGLLLNKERQIQKLEKQQERAKRIAELAQMIQEYNHEIKTPQTALLQYIDLMDYEDIKNMPEKEWHESRSKMKSFIKRTIDTVNSTLLLTPRQTFPNLDKVNINDCIVEVIENYTEMKYEVEFKKDPIGMISGVKSEICLILNNLIKNSLDAFHSSDQDNGRLIIRTRMINDMVQVEIEDNGPGIPDDIISTIWTPFSTSNKSSGTGLGLSTVQARVIGHGGSISVDSNIGEGTKFTILFPVTLDDE